MLALLALLAAALLALLGARRAAAPGAWVPLKRWALGGILLLCGAWKQRAACGGAAEPRRPRLLSPDPHALDSVYFTGFAETNKSFVIARLAKRPNGICEMWLFLRVDGVGEFEHPQHPNMMVNDESEEIWSGGGLTIEYLELQALWKISFNGFLRKGPYRQQWSEEEGELVPVKFSLHWENSTEVFSFRDDSHPSTFVRAFAQEPWTIEFFQRVKKQREQHFRHEQWGQSVGEIEIKNHEKIKLSLKGVRSHSYGVRNWSDIYRYVMILARFEDGTAAHLTVINMPATTTNLTVGYVFFPDGKKAGIEWSNASLAEMADDGVIKDEYRVSFTAGGKHFDVSARLDKQACPVVYSGLTGRGVFHECIADFQLDGLTQGWGLAEFYYRKDMEWKVGVPCSSGASSCTACGTAVLTPARDLLPFLVKEAREKSSKEEYAKVLAMEIYALLMTANGDLVEHVLEEDGRKIGRRNEVLQHGVVYVPNSLGTNQAKHCIQTPMFGSHQGTYPPLIRPISSRMHSFGPHDAVAEMLNKYVHLDIHSDFASVKQIVTQDIFTNIRRSL